MEHLNQREVWVGDNDQIPTIVRYSTRSELEDLVLDVMREKSHACWVTDPLGNWRRYEAVTIRISPPQCHTCGEEVAEDAFICDYCREEAAEASCPAP